MPKISVVLNGEEHLFSWEEWEGWCLLHRYSVYGIPKNWFYAIKNNLPLPETHLFFPLIKHENGRFEQLPEYGSIKKLFEG